MPDKRSSLSTRSEQDPSWLLKELSMPILLEVMKENRHVRSCCLSSERQKANGKGDFLLTLRLFQLKIVLGTVHTLQE